MKDERIHLIRLRPRREALVRCCAFFARSVFLCLCGVILFSSSTVLAADRESARKVAEANRAVAAGKFDEAVKLYDEVGKAVPDSPELAYDRGVAYYRKGERTKAVESFEKALLTRDIKLEARTKFNLGNCAYADAIEKQGDFKAAMEKLKTAISYYKDAIGANPDDVDAKVNMETAQLFMKHLLDQEKKKEDEQKKNPQSQPESQPSSQPESRPESQPASQPQSQPEQPQSQPASQPQSGDQQKEQQGKDGKQDQQKQGDQKEDQEKSGQQENKPGEKQDGKKLEAQNAEKGDKDEQKGEQKQAQSVQVMEMSKEEAEKLLQMIRDREQQRREALMLLQRSQQQPVDKDW